MIKKITQDLFELKRKYPDEDIKIATKESARNYISKFPNSKIASFNNDDPAIINEVKKIIGGNKSILIVADADLGKYDIYAF